MTSYRIYRGTVAGGETLLSTVPSVLTYLDTPLARGQTYYYQVSAISAIGEGARSTEVYATPVAPVDTTPPTIAITQPANNSVLAEATGDVAGTAADDVAIQVVELSADGTKWTRATGTGSWSGTLALSTGTNSILARATDSSGNTRTATIKVTVQSTGSPMPSFLSPALLAAILTTAAVLAAAVLLRSRRRKRVNQPPGGTS